MPELIPRLWPFLSHSTSSVRKSTLFTLKTLTGCNAMPPSVIQSTSDIKTESNTVKCSLQSDDLSVDRLISVDPKNLSLNFGVKEWPHQLLQEAMRHIYQRVLVEHLPDVQCIAEDVWYNLVTNANLTAILHAACPCVSSWMCLAMQPARLAFDPAMMIYAKANTSNGARVS